MPQKNSPPILDRFRKTIELVLPTRRQSKTSTGISAAVGKRSTNKASFSSLARLAWPAVHIFSRLRVSTAIEKIKARVSASKRSSPTLVAAVIIGLCCLWLQASGIYYYLYKDGGNKLAAICLPPYTWYKSVEFTYGLIRGDSDGMVASTGTAAVGTLTAAPSAVPAKQLPTPEQPPPPIQRRETVEQAKSSRASPFEPPGRAPNSPLDNLRARASMGDAAAQYDLGLIYAKGEGVPKDDKAAVEWFRMAAEQGEPRGQNALGKHFAEARGVPEDPGKAVELFRMAAEQGYASAAYNLGVMYETGRGVSKDNVAAIVWYRKAANQGDAEATKALATFQDRKRE